jgi:Protein of unknown function (DUF4235)
MSTLMKIAYRPIGVLSGLLAGFVAGAVFKRLWKLAAREDEAPKATDQRRGWTEVVLAAAVKGAVFASVRAAVDRAGATGFARATGVWPGRTARS